MYRLACSVPNNAAFAQESQESLANVKRVLKYYLFDTPRHLIVTLLTWKASTWKAREGSVIQTLRVLSCKL